MSIASVVTGGFGNGTFDPGVSLVVTDGFTIGDAPAPETGGYICGTVSIVAAVPALGTLTIEPAIQGTVTLNGCG